MKLKKDYSKVKCYSCHEFGHVKFRCPKNKKSHDALQKADEALFGVGEAFFTSHINDADIWIPDTGASHHMTKSKEWFVSYTAFDEPKSVILGNKQVMLAYGQGDIEIETLVDGFWQKHHLKDV